MGFERATRSSETRRIPLLCDPALRDRIARYILRAGPEREAQEAEADRVRSMFRLFAETLDPSVLRQQLGDDALDGVTHITIRGLSGEQFAAASDAAALAHDRYPAVPLRTLVEAEYMRAGLVSIDSFDEVRGPTGYPVEVLYAAGGIGREWPQVRAEVAARIDAWSHLGKPAGSSSAPSSGEPMPSDAGRTSLSVTDPAEE